MLKTYLNKAFALFFILGFVFIPLTFYGLGGQYWLTRSIFEKPVAFLQHAFFADAITRIDFSSDTIGLNILLGLLLVIALVSVGLLSIFKRHSTAIIPFFRSLSVYYVALILLKYGFDKVFKQQFYLPEPNILYSSFGSLHKDILFWSTIGTSHLYSVITGSIEILTAILILAKPTRILGFCIAVAVLFNILLINFSFDISVKTFTFFLLAVVLFNVHPYLKAFYAFFVSQKQSQLPQAPTFFINKWLVVCLSTGVIFYTLLPYLQAGNFNDDHAPRPFLHGAYQIDSFKTDNQSLNKCDFPYKRFFIHRNSYIIFQQQDDQMVDYHFELNAGKNQLILYDYQQHTVVLNYTYSPQAHTLQLEFNNRQKWAISATALNWQSLPALQDEWHYTVDEIK